MAAEIIEDNDVAGLEGWHQALLDPCSEGHRIDRSVEYKGSNDAVVAQAGKEGQVFQWPCGTLAISGWPRSYQPWVRVHVGFDPGFIHEHQPARINPMLMGLPACPKSRHFRSVLFAGDQCFFKCFAFTAQETPNGVVRDLNACSPQSRTQEPALSNRI